jgi:hypothetical protein
MKGTELAMARFSGPKADPYISGVPFPYLHLLAYYFTECKIGVKWVRTGMIRPDGRFSDSNFDQESR